MPQGRFRWWRDRDWQPVPDSLLLATGQVGATPPKLLLGQAHLRRQPCRAATQFNRPCAQHYPPQRQHGDRAGDDIGFNRQARHQTEVLMNHGHSPLQLTAVAGGDFGIGKIDTACGGINHAVGALQQG